MSSTSPTYIYKLLPPTTPPPTPLPASLPLSALDATSGFIHLSTAPQVPNTLHHFFGTFSRVFVLRIPLARVGAHIRWESPEGDVCGPRPGEGLFPHLYNGGRLGAEEVESVGVWSRGEGEGWGVVCEREREGGWLVD